MKNNLNRDYTLNARRFTFKYPILTKISTQINFWVIAYMLLAGILYNYTILIDVSYPGEKIYAPAPAFLGSFIMAYLYGTALGLSDHFIFSRWNTRWSLGLLILIKGVFYLLIMSIIFMFMRYVFWDMIILSHFFNGIAPFIIDESWPYVFRIFALYTLAMGMVISFIIQVNKKFGPGVLIPLLLGKYLSPVKEERIFMFLDLESSTTIAEELGHIQYSNLIRDCFLEINFATLPFQAEIYQYVGDEIVLTWLVKDDTQFLNPINFYFECERRLNKKKEHFLSQYNVMPTFKAGIHYGWVTGVEVGNIKREVAYHGDTINVASRIQQKCKEYNCDLLISDSINERINWTGQYTVSRHPRVELTGRQKPITVFEVEDVSITKKEN